MVLLTPDENVIPYILPNGETLYRKQSTSNVLAFNSSNYIYHSVIITNEALVSPYIQGSLTVYGNVETTFGNSVIDTLQTNFINLLKDDLPAAGNYNTRLYNPYFTTVYAKQLTFPNYASITADSYFILLGPLTTDVVETDTGFGYRPPLVLGPSEFVLTTTSAKWYLPATFIPSYKSSFSLYAGIVYYFIVSFTAFDNNSTARSVSATFTITFGTTTIYTATVYFEAIQRYKQVCKTFTYTPVTTITVNEFDGDNYIAVNSTTANVQLDNATTYGHQLHVMVMSGGKYSL